jgi:phage baseplate assembly protein W
MRAVRYRTGINRRTGQMLRGIAHVHQSLETIWTTRLGERVMRLPFGSVVRGHLSEDITPGLALQIYASLVEAAHAFEPEYRISSLRLVRVTRDGALGLTYSGTYYPEGRFGNHDIAVADSAAAAISFNRLTGAAA